MNTKLYREWTVVKLKDYLSKRGIYITKTDKKPVLFEKMMKSMSETQMFPPLPIAAVASSSTSPLMSPVVSRWMTYIGKVKNTKIVLLRDPDVVSWLYRHFDYLNGRINGLEVDVYSKSGAAMNRNKRLEDNWGKDLMHREHPELKFDKQWTNKFGEYLLCELVTLMGETCIPAGKIENYKPDFTSDTAVWEVKTGSYFTEGTAHEKIMGTLFKYLAVPRLFGKPLKIVCIGGAEEKARYYECLDCKTPEKQEALDFYKSKKIEVVGFSDLMQSLLKKA